MAKSTKYGRSRKINMNLFKKKKKKKKLSRKDQLLALQLELANKEKALHQAVYDSFPENVKSFFDVFSDF